MSEKEEPRIIVPDSDEAENQEEELKYKATEADEEKFFLMYHLNWPPSEVDSLTEDRRKWLIARFVGQKQLEREAMQQMRIREQVLPNLQGGGPPDFRVTD
jgi:hypothetical protein